MSLEDPFDKEADRILKMARGLCLLLDPLVLYLKSMVWIDSTRYLRGGGGEQCLRTMASFYHPVISPWQSA